MTIAIEVCELSKSFAQKQVLNNVNLQVPSGSIFAFLGNNGAGKSTLIRILLGLLKADHGHFFIHQRRIKSHLYQYRKEIGCIIDSSCIYEHLTPKEFLGITCKVKALNKSVINEALSLVNMKAYSDDRISQFSLGMKQRISLANALLGQPSLLILDEPTNGLDPRGMQEIRTLLKDLSRNTGVTIFLSSHLLDEIEKTATHIAVLHEGVIQIQSPLTDLLKKQKGHMLLKVNSTTQIHQHMLSHGYSCEKINDNTIKIANVKQSQCANINTIVINQGFKLYESLYQRPSLESFFLETVDLMGGKSHGV